MSALPARSRLARWAPLLVSAGLAVGATVVLRNVNPYVAGNPLPSCPLYALTGLYCPGCGSTRCLYSLVHFDLPGAMAMNPLLVVSILPMLVLALHTLYLFGWYHQNMSLQQQLGVALLAYFTYCINAGQFIWKLRAARLQQAREKQTLIGVGMIGAGAAA